MAVDVMRWVWDHSKAAGTSRFVLLAIADCCSRSDGTGAFPSMAELKRKTGLSERTIQTAFVKLTELGELKVDRNAGPKGCNRYTVVGPTPADFAPPQILRPEDVAGSNVRLFPQANRQTPADSAPPADFAPPQDSTGTPADFAPGTTKEPPTTKRRKTSRPEPADRPDVEALCARLADGMVRNGSKRPKISDEWRREARLLLDTDERDLDKALKLIDWCQNDTFWRANIRSMPKFREKYEQLRLKALAEWERNHKPFNDDRPKDYHASW